MVTPMLVQAALNDLIRVYLIAKELHATLPKDARSDQPASHRVQNLPLANGVIDRLTASEFRDSDVLCQFKALNNQLDERVELVHFRDAFGT
jgi:hypothetical protein